MSERHDIWKVADAIQMDLGAAQAKMVQLRAKLAAVDLPGKEQTTCPRCGAKLPGALTLAEHLYVSHDGPTPAHWVALEAKIAEEEAA